MIKQPSLKDKKNFQQAMNELNNGSPEKAIKLFAKVRKSWCENADIFYLEGLAYGKLGKSEYVKRASKKALKIDPNHFGAMCNLANALIGMHESTAAIEYYEKALKVKPNAAEIMDNYGRALSIIGRREESIDIFLESLKVNGSHAPTHAALGKVYAEAGQLEKAKKEFNTALNLDDQSPEAHIGKGILSSGTGALEQAEQHFNKAIEYDKRNVEAYVGLANVKRYSAEYDVGLNFIKKAEKLSPGDTSLLSLKAHLLEQKGDKNEAYRIINKLLDNDSVSAQTVTVFSKLCRQYERSDEAIDLINKTIDRIDVSSTDKQALLYAAGDLLDKLKRYDEAMEYYNKANSMLDIVCDRKVYKQLYSDMTSCYSKSNLLKYSRSNVASSRPVFIVGMPRSGTTLTEQILSSHNDVFGAGELHFIKEIDYKIKEISSDITAFFNGADSDRLNEFTRSYLDSINKLDDDAKYIVDKMPHNFMYLGLISILFPEAKIIHCRRHPLDNALSIYFQSFIWTHDYALDLGDIGFFYGFYDKLMGHWENVLGDRILTVQYEDMVDNQEAMSRKILEFCDLEWDESVLDFHKTERSVGTASYDQVRQPMYKTSKERWRNYQKHIQPLYDNLPGSVKKHIEL